MSEQQYTITEVSQKYHINANTLRYYERIGLLPTIPRWTNGNRYFTQSILNWLEMVICLRHSGVPIEVLIEYSDLIKQGPDTLQAREDLLREQLDTLYTKRDNLARSIQRLEHKIHLHETKEILKEHSYYEEYAIAADEKNSWKDLD